MDLDLQGKRVLITGASKGIGAGSARAFAREGASLDLVARNADALQALKLEITDSYGVAVRLHALDLSQTDNQQSLVDNLDDLDILINNAGNIPAGSLEDVSDAEWRSGWDLKVFGFINLTRLVYPRMRAGGGGVIINNIGNAGERLDVDYLAGSTGNAGLMAFTRALGGRSLDDGIRVVGVNTGMVQTDRMAKLLKARAKKWFGDESRHPELLSRFPLGRGATVDEVADLIIFLASPRSSYTSGCIVTLDGGVTARHSIV